jgi:BlaI family penicillinase repressor
MEKLTAAEEEAMKAIWKSGEGIVKLFLAAMDDPRPPYTTLASTIKNLEKKGYVSSRLVGNAYLYKPAISEEAYKGGSVNGLVKEYFDNSYKALVNFFIEQKRLSADELRELIGLIEEKNDHPVK